MFAKIIVVAAALAVCASGAAIPKFKGVLATAQYRCDDFLCPDWELDVARVDPSFDLHLITKLATLVPKSPIASMSFPIYTAYHDASRTFYTLGLPEANGGSLWAVQIDNAVNSSTLLYSTRFELPTGVGKFSRIHASANNTLFVIFDDGALFIMDGKTGKFTSVANIIASNATGYKVSPASVINPATDTLYAFLSNGGDSALGIFSLSTERVLALPMTFKHEHMSLEYAFQALWISSRNAIGLVIAGASGDSGFDMIVLVNPTTAETTYLFDNLAESNLFFMCDMNTKACDVLQTAAYDAIEDRIYFQATSIVGDDVGTTVLMFVDLTHKNPYIDTGLNPFTFGYMGFSFVPILH